MKFKHSSRPKLAAYVTDQVRHFFPDRKRNVAAAIERDLDEALSRLRTCINAVRIWRKDEFFHLHTDQYATFLYFLANTVWRNRRDEVLSAKLSALNKALHGINCFYDVEMPAIFFIGHAVGIVLARAEYSNFFVVLQNCTVGKDRDKGPAIGEGVVMFPNSAIIGGVKVGANTILSQGASLVNRDAPGNCVVTRGTTGSARFTPIRYPVLPRVFRDW